MKRGRGCSEGVGGSVGEGRGMGNGTKKDVGSWDKRGNGGAAGRVERTIEGKKGS